MPQMRCGVRMFPQTAHIFDIIKRAGPQGISGEDLFEIAYAGARRKHPAYSTVKGHITHARSALEDTDYRIVCERAKHGPGTYRLVKVVRLKAFETVS
jgi:hypothetical protein